MKINICKNTIVIACVSILLSIPLSAKIDNTSQAVNKSGQQRMITQRMLKDYALIGMNNTYGNPKEDLIKMIALFDNNLKELKGYLKDKKALKSLKEEIALWKPIKKTLQKEPKRSSVSKLSKELEKLLKSAHKTTELISKTSGEKATDIVNTAGKQRMLSQRMASLYMLKVWEVTDKSFSKKLSAALKEFEVSQKKLLSSELNTDKIKVLLIKSKKAFRYFQMTAKSKSKKYIPSLINRSANKILKNMDTVTNMYSSK